MSHEHSNSSEYTSDKFWNYHPKLPLKFAPYFDKPKNIKAITGHWLKGWRPLGTQCIFLVVAFLIWTFATPSLERTATFSLDWVFEIWLRDMMIMLVVVGSLHLYLHTFKVQGTELKYDKRELATSSKRFLFNNQNHDNIFLTLTGGVAFWVFWESLLLWAYANGYASLITFDSNPIWCVVLLLLIPIWSYHYFDMQHRIMHKDWLYKKVHYIHHKNGNMGPWSGLAMHPVEQFVLMSDTLIFMVVASHPIHAIYSLVFHGLGAPLSHTGFDKIKFGDRLTFNFGDFYHQLHHRFFDSNFGTLDTPFDLNHDCFHDGTMEGHRRFMAKRKKQS